MKRAFDFLFALFFIVLFFPVFLAVGLVVFISDRLPVIFKQERTGKNSKVFIAYKFRTMKQGSEGKLVENENDKRIIKHGKFLRKLNLDELPQLINILRGEMSFIGPRADPVFVNKKLGEIRGWGQRFKIRPGLTGLAQVNNKSSFQPAEKLRYDLDYIKYKSFWLDLKIIAKTIKLFFKKLKMRK